LQQSLNQPRTLEQWADWFRAELAPSDLEPAGLLAFMHHFADLGLLEPVDETQWQLGGVDTSQPSIRLMDAVRSRLEALSGGDEGIAVACFLGRRPKTSFSPLKKSHPQPLRQGSGENIPPNREKASDLSNLQIVKKLGRQLQPFLDFERQTLSRLLGTHTQQKDARIIFNFILRQTQQKAEPKKWEQLSRKRHK